MRVSLCSSVDSQCKCASIHKARPPKSRYSISEQGLVGARAERIPRLRRRRRRRRRMRPLPPPRQKQTRGGRRLPAGEDAGGGTAQSWGRGWQNCCRRGRDLFAGEWAGFEQMSWAVLASSSEIRSVIVMGWVSYQLVLGMVWVINTIYFGNLCIEMVPFCVQS